MPGTRTAALWFALASIALCGSCSSDTQGPPQNTPTITEGGVDIDVTPACSAANVLRSLGLVLIDRPAEPDAPDVGTIPAGFQPASVIVCDSDWATMTSVSLVETHRNGDLGDVLQAFGRPSEPLDHTCTVDQPQPPTVFLVDELGEAVRPSLPHNRCGAWDFTAIDRISQLPVAQRTVYEVRPAQL